MLLLRGIRRLKEWFKVKNGLTSSLLFVFCFILENAKNLDRWDDTKRRKKEDGLEGVERSDGSWIRYIWRKIVLFLYQLSLPIYNALQETETMKLRFSVVMLFIASQV